MGQLLKFLINSHKMILKKIKFWPFGLLLVISFILIGLHGNITRSGINSFYLTIIDLLREASFAYIVAFIVSMIMQSSDVVQIFNHQLKGLLYEHSYIKDLSLRKKIELRQTIEESIYSEHSCPEHSQDYDNSLNKFFLESIEPLIDKYFYLNNDTDIKCTVKNIAGNLVFEKDVTTTLVISNPTKYQQSVTIPFGLYTQKINGIQDNQIFKLIEYRVDNQPLTHQIKIDSQPITGKDRLSHINCNYNLAFDGKHIFNLDAGKKKTVKINTKTIAPISDEHFLMRLSTPCKSFKITFELVDERGKYNLQGDAFVFMQLEKRNKAVYNNTIVLNFSNWMLPGEGVVYTITKKKEGEE